MRIALIGNQNSGKTTLFNLLTGSNQKVGNWPGVTIERKSGTIKNTDHELVDLPGVYSLSPYTSEEDISRKFILNEDIDVIINIVDATSIERSLYLTTQLLELDTKVIVALNMNDLVQSKGIYIDVKSLEEQLGCKVVNISALKKTGVDELIKAIDEVGDNKPISIFDEFIQNKINIIASKINTKDSRFISTKLLEKDPLFVGLYDEEIETIKNEIEAKYDMEIVEVFASKRYDFIEKVINNSLKKQEEHLSVSDKIDKVLLNKYLAIPIFIVIMFLVYYLSVGVVGSWTVDFIDGLVGKLSEATDSWLRSLDASDWAVSLVVDGIIAGVGAVINFVPQLIILFLLIALLETTGYMSRISFLLDKLFKRFGLSGKSLIPFIVGSGCSVPGIMTTRTIEDESEKRMSILLTPFIPCSAKLPIIALFAGFFFKENSGLVSASLYFLSVIVIIVSAILLKKFVYKGASTSYISELPEYKLPHLTYILRDVYEKSFAFIKRAGTIILLSSIIIWFLSSFSWKMEYGVDINTSILATIGKSLSWIFYPMLGENSWGATVSAIQGLVAKEQVVTSMNVIAGVAEDALDGALFQGGIFGFFTPLSAYAFMVFNLFSAPCFGAIGAMRKEFGNTKDMLKAIAFQTAVAWILATLIFRIGSLL